MIVEEKKQDNIYYIGIGASAGGLEALQDFFKVMPEDTGMVFIVVQHLSPDYKSLMDELLARHTNMPIKIAEDGMETKPNTIYLIPPKHNLSIFHGKLYLEKHSGMKGLNLPIDIFFRSLARDKEKNAVGVVLSGTGSDGTLGIKAIKESGGMVMVQDEKSAKFDGMPRSSIATGLVDYILKPDQMAEELLNYIKHPFIQKSDTTESIMSKNLDTLTKIVLILRDHSGVDFSYYKENTIIRRLERRVSINRLNSLDEYLSFLSQSEKEKETLYRELLIGVTRFFRDQEAFASLSERVIPEIIDHKKNVRIWSAGCSTGEEVYSIAMVCKEYADKNKIDCDIKIFATDIDRYAIDIASQGIYPESIVADVESDLLAKYFIRLEEGYQVNETIRKMVVFANHNILKDPPFSKLDLLICRNLFIYLKADMQQKVLATFYYSLSPGGYLFLGNSEHIGDMSEAFTSIDSKWKIYKYKDGFKPPLIRDLVISAQDGRTREYMAGRNTSNLKAEKLIETAMSTVLPPSVIIDSHENVIHVFNSMNDFFDIKSGKFSSNLLSNLPNDLAIFVSSTLRKLKTEKKNVIYDNITGIKSFEDSVITLEGKMITFNNDEYYLISFIRKDKEKVKMVIKDSDNLEQDYSKEMGARIDDLEKELQFTKESLQATVEELETSNEELQSSNEELIASNEELQSTNEELQSVNEELYTVNSEHQSKIEQLTRLNADLDNLLKNTQVGALYLDRNLCIRKITPVVSKITNIMNSDIGRPISHISVMTAEINFVEDIQHVVETLQGVEREIKDRDGKYWLVRIRPYRTDYNAVEGIILTFIEITDVKEQQNSYKRLAERLENALKIGNIAWWEWDLETNHVIYDQRKATMLGYAPEEFPDDVYEICSLVHPEDYQMVMKKMEDHISGKEDYWDAIYRIKRKDGQYGWYYDRGYTTEWTDEGKPKKIIGTVINISKLKEAELLLEKTKCQLEDKIK